MDTNDSRRAASGADVLVAEDSAESALLIESYLEALGLSFVRVTTGADLLARAQSEDFRLLLIDHSLPDMNGTEALKQLRINGCAVPAVSISASMSPEDEQLYRAAGFTDMLGKPFKREEFIVVVSKFISSPMQGIAAEAGWEDLARQFAERLPEKVQDLVQSCERGDIDRARFLAHKIRGSALFGFEEVSQVCGKLEEAFKSELSDGVPELLRELQTAVEKLRS